MSTSLYKRTEVIGRGKFGVVYKGYNKQTKHIVAIKVLNLDTQEDEVADVQQEIQFLTELKHVPNVTHYYGSILDDTMLCIIMDYCAGGSVRTLLKAGHFEERYISVITRELLIGLLAVHSMGVIHRDLKAANVLISKEGNVQLCDFGVAAKINSVSYKRSTMAGTPYWMAPEVIREGDTYNSKADIWSLGITLFEIATGNPPYGDKDAMWAMQMISKLTPPRLEGREYSSGLKETVALCLDENPVARPLADDLLKCRLVKTHRNQPTYILKEVISRYLLWRDSSRTQDDMPHDDGTEMVENQSNNLHVKWDFDSLSSREYIMDNDIDIPESDAMDNTYDLKSYDNYPGDNYPTEPTLKNGGQDYSNTNSYKPGPNPNNEIPKSLQSLFEESPELPSNNGIFEPPNVPEPRMDSPTIEIPDIENLEKIPSQVNITNPPLSKPPALYHSQSASGNLESRFNSTGGNRPRKKTISNTYGSTGSANYVSPHTPPYSTSSSNKTPSPKPPPNPGFGSNLGGTVGTKSPSKSMKALQSTTNPLLQPINFKANEEEEESTNGGMNGGTTTTTGTNTNTTTGTNTTTTTNTTNTTNTNTSNSNPPRRPKPGLHIQMPTPSTSHTLSALTNESNFDSNAPYNETMNQFGIKTSQVGSLSMTPLTEKDAFIDADKEKNEVPDEKSTPHSRDRAESFPFTSRNPNMAPRKMTTNSIPQNPKPWGTNSPGISKQTTKFPPIPNINGEFLLDSTPKENLVQELEFMLKEFGLGLEALNERL